MNAAEKLSMTYAQYLALERETGVRHEFIDGIAYAMAGGTLAHARLGATVSALLFALLRPGRGRCRVYSADGKVHVLVRGNSYYPDASVVCGPVVAAPHDSNAITNPTVVVEVLSETTERRDAGIKFRDYQRIPSLRHYLMVSQDEHRVEHYRRNDDGTWTFAVAESGGVVQLPDLGGTLAVDDIYVGEDLERPAEG